MAAVRWWLGPGCPQSSALPPGTAEAWVQRECGTARSCRASVLHELSPAGHPDLRIQGSQDSAGRSFQALWGCGPELARPHFCSILSVKVPTPPPRSTSPDALWGSLNAGRCVSQGVFGDHAPGPHQRRPKLPSHLPQTSCRSLRRRGSSRSCWRRSRPTWRDCTC